MSRSPIRIAAALLGVVVLSVLGAACQKKLPPKSTPDSEVVRPKHLKHIVNDHARQSTKLRGWDTALDVWAVYEGWEYRKALFERRATARKWSAQERDEKLARQRNEFDTNVSFVFAVYGSEKKWMLMDQAPPVWLPVLMLPDGGYIKPSSIKEIKLPSDEVREAYPFINIWQKQFRVVYPRTETESGKVLLPTEADRLTIEFSSILGMQQLQWEFAQPGS